MKGRPQVLRHGAAHVRDSDRAAVADRGHLAIRTSRERSTSAEPLRVRMQPLDQARTEIREARLADRTGMYGMLKSVAGPESSLVPRAFAHESEQRRDAGKCVALRPAKAAPDSGQVEQSVATASGLDAKFYAINTQFNIVFLLLGTVFGLQVATLILLCFILLS